MRATTRGRVTERSVTRPLTTEKGNLRMKRSTMLTSIVFGSIVLGTLVAPMPADAAGLTDTWYIFQVAAKAPGQAGTNWKTSLCIFNPWSKTLTFDIALIDNTDILASGQTSVRDSQTVCFGDVLGSLGMSRGFGVLTVRERTESNTFAATSRIYNDAGARGTFGQQIEPISANDPWEYIYSGEVAMISGVSNFGSAGSYGYRTNVGLMNPNLYGIWARVTEVAENGSSQNFDVYVNPLSIYQYQMHRTLEAGTLLLQGDNLLAYASIVDNKSGDAILVGHRALYEMRNGGLKSNGIDPSLVDAILVDTKSTNRNGGVERRIPDGLLDLVRSIEPTTEIIAEPIH